MKPVSLRVLFDGIVDNAPDLLIAGMSSNSRHLQAGELFLACGGERSHGLDYIDQLAGRSVAAVAWEPTPGRAAPALPADVVGFAVPELRRHLGMLGDRFYGSPSSQIAVTGITGTNGKTTTAWLAAQALQELGHRTAYMGTLGHGVLPKLTASRLTTPGCIEVHRRLHGCADDGVSHAMMEVSSHALDQGRVDGVRFAVAALTNLSQDHLDYHGSLEAYAAAKARLFIEHEPAGVVLNVGDEFGRRLVGRLPEGATVITVALVETGAAPPGVRLMGRLTAARRDGLGLSLSGDFGEAEIHSSLWGRFNAENLVVAAGILLANGCVLDQVAAALGRATAPPGRMQSLTTRGPGPAVIIDFAHTPDALENALNAVRQHCDGQVWCVFGCGGNRDRSKRAPMAAVVERLADRFIVTDDNPRNEDPARIVADILAGFSSGATVEVLHERGIAIDRAIAAAAPEDAVLIAGKGHETRQVLAGTSRRFSDLDAARAALDRVE
ncbi:MAG: UDP-N-acetylmuramoyl-L-alanyl-D-glutamate--2,6-diaminopimelate ligase [Gammaproteobacteria bacterium]|nr:UDP-N-acetylmuramoyl-L-alanyl-D-glutamate--2,6-diaminopimelate ligase [Gammaproteobacteria bacterium]